MMICINADIYMYRKYTFIKNIINIRYMYIYILLSIQCHFRSLVHVYQKKISLVTLSSRKN